MTDIRKPAFAILAVTTVAALAGCAGGGQEAPPAGFAEDGTFTMTLVADPGALDPQLSVVSSLFQLTQFAYDPLVSLTPDGEPTSALASAWNVEGTTATFTIQSGITCSDGTAFTAQTAADNMTWIQDPANQSPFLGAFVPAGVTAAAEGDVLTLTLAAPAPFLLQSLANLPMVCDAGLEDRAALADATIGTGPYVLTEAVPNDHYTYELNEDYAWGPDGIGADEPGLPTTITARIIPNETTSANLLLNGEVNAAQVIGPDAQRVEAADLFTQEVEGVLGEQWYNHGESHLTSDPAVRMALTQALDLAELQKVITSGTGSAATRLTVVPPSACDYDAVSGNVPAMDVEAAKAALDDAGWIEGADGIREKGGKPLELAFIYANTLGTGGTAASELAVTAWQELGVSVTATQQDSTAASTALFGTGAWDIAWVPVNINNPDQIVAFVSGTPIPDGANFAGIQNAEYDAAVAEAMALSGSESCPKWEEAEAALFSAADMVPFANAVIRMFGNGAEFSTELGHIAPMSIRMLAE